MKSRLRDVFSWSGTIDRRSYVLLGSLFFLVKFYLDWQVASLFFHREWTPFHYLKPSDVVGGILSLDREEQYFYATMAAIAVPFIWIGVGLTLRRLRDVRLPLWLVACFFLPMPINVLFFGVLGALGGRPQPPATPKVETGPPTTDSEFVALAQKQPAQPLPRRGIIPRDPLAGQVVSILISVPIAIGLCYLSVAVMRDYGWGVFLGVPFAGPLAAVVLYGIPVKRTYSQCLGAGLLWVAFMFMGLTLVAMEGWICLVMMLPLAIPIALMGATVGYLVHNLRLKSFETLRTLGVLLVLVPALMGAEAAVHPVAAVFMAKTAIEVNAPPETVWTHVLSFRELPPPDDWIFRTGIAYPIRAEIEGRGPGAVRHCVFSTGAFIEPIEVWDEPRLLQFAVVNCPPPMREWNPFFEIDPPHLNNFLVAKRGEFRLTRLAGGRTRIEGTTWYQHNMWPAGYWRLWSDRIIQRIHRQVLRHIKLEAERTNSARGDVADSATIATTYAPVPADT